MAIRSAALFASPICFVLSHAAAAADLPSKAKGPAVDYVRVCDAYGKGFFYILGTDTCLKVGGYIRADYAVRSTDNVLSKKVGGLVLKAPLGIIAFPSTNSQNGLDSSGFRVRGRVEFDARSKSVDIHRRETLRAKRRVVVCQSKVGVTKHPHSVRKMNSA